MSSSSDAILRGLGIELGQTGNTNRGSYRNTLSKLLENQTLQAAQADAAEIIQRRQISDFEQQQRALQRQQEAAAKAARERDTEVARFTEGFDAQVQNGLFRELSERDRETLRSTPAGALQAERLANETLERATRERERTAADPTSKAYDVAVLRQEAAQAVAQRYTQIRADTVSPEQANALSEALQNPTSGPGTFVRNTVGSALSGLSDVGEFLTGRNPINNAVDSAADLARRDTLSVAAANQRGADRTTFGERRDAGEGAFQAALNVAGDVARNQNPGSLIDLGAATTGNLLAGGVVRQGARVAANAGNLARQATAVGPTRSVGSVANQARQQRLIDRSFSDARPNNFTNRTINNAADIAPSLAVANASAFTDNRDSLEAQLGRSLTGGEELALRAGAGGGAAVQSGLFGAAAAAVPGLRAIGIGASGTTRPAGTAATLGGTVAAEAGQEAIENISSQVSRNVVDPNRTLFDIDPDQTIEAATLGGVAGAGAGAGRGAGALFSRGDSVPGNAPTGGNPVDNGPVSPPPGGGTPGVDIASPIPLSSADTSVGAVGTASRTSPGERAVELFATQPPPIAQPAEPLPPEPAFFEPPQPVGQAAQVNQLAQRPAPSPQDLSSDEFLGALQSDTFDTQMAQSGLFEPQSDGRISLPSIFDTRTAEGAGGARARVVLLQATEGRTDPFTGDDAAQGTQVLDTFGRRAVSPEVLGNMLRAYAYDAGVAASAPSFEIPTDAARSDTANEVTTRFNKKLVSTLGRLTREDGDSRARRSDGTPVFRRTETGFEINNTPFVGEGTSPLVNITYDAVSDTESASLGVEPAATVDPGAAPAPDPVPDVPAANTPAAQPTTGLPPTDSAPDSGGVAPRPTTPASTPAAQQPIQGATEPLVDVQVSDPVNPVAASPVAPAETRAPIPTIAAPIADAQVALANERHESIVQDYLQTRAGQSENPEAVIRNPIADRTGGAALTEDTRALVSNLQAVNSAPLTQSIDALNRSTGGRLANVTVLDLSNPQQVEALQTTTPQQLQELGIRQDAPGRFSIDTGSVGLPSAGSYDPTNQLVVVDPRVTAPNLDNIPETDFDGVAYAFNLTTVSEELGHHLEEDVLALPENMFQDLRTSYVSFLNAAPEARAAHFGVTPEEFATFPPFYQDSFNEWVGKGLGLELERNAIVDAQGSVNTPDLPGRVRQIFQRLAGAFRARLAQIANLRRASASQEFNPNTGLSEGLSFPDVVRHFRKTPRTRPTEARVQPAVDAVPEPEAPDAPAAVDTAPDVDTPAPVEVGQRKKSFPEETAEQLRNLRDQFVEIRAVAENVEDVVRPYKRSAVRKRLSEWLADVNNITTVKTAAEFNDEIRDLAREQDVDLDNAIASVLRTDDRIRLIVNEGALPVEHPGLHAELEIMHALLKAGVYPRRLRNVLRGLSRGTDKFATLKTLASGPLEEGDLPRMAVADAQRRLNQGDLLPAVSEDQFFSRDINKFQDVARNFIRVLPKDLGAVIEFAWSPADVVRFLGAHAADGLSTDLGITWHNDMLVDPIVPTESSSGELEKRIIGSIEINNFDTEAGRPDNRRFSLHTASSGKRDDFTDRANYFTTVGGGDTMASRLRRSLSNLIARDGSSLYQAASELGFKATDLPSIVVDKLSKVEIRDLNQQVKRTARRGQFAPESKAESLQESFVNYLRPLQQSQRALTNDAGTNEGYSTEQTSQILGTDVGIESLADTILEGESTDLLDRQFRAQTLAKLRQVRDAFVAKGNDLFDQVSMYSAHTTTNALSNQRYAVAAKDLEHEARGKLRAVTDAVRAARATGFTRDQAREMVSDQMRDRHMIESAMDRIMFHSQIVQQGQKLPAYVERLTSSELEKKSRLTALYQYLNRDTPEFDENAQTELAKIVVENRSNYPGANRALARLRTGTPGNDVVRDLIKLEVFATTRPIAGQHEPDLAGNARAESTLLNGDNDIGVVGLWNANLFGTNLHDATVAVSKWSAATADGAGAAVDAAVTDAIQTYRKLIELTQLNNWNSNITDVGTAQRSVDNQYEYNFPIRNTEFVRDDLGEDVDLAQSLSDLGGGVDSVSDTLIDNTRVTRKDAANFVDPISAIEHDLERSYQNEQRNEGNYTILANIAMDRSLADEMKPEALQRLMDDSTKPDGKSYTLEFVRSEDRAERLQELANSNANVLTVPMPRTQVNSLREGLQQDDGITALVVSQKAKGERGDLVNTVRGNRQRSKGVQRLRASRVGNAIAQTTAFLGDVHTRKSPNYPLVALFRDTLTGMVQLGANEGLRALPEYGKAVARATNPKNVQTAFVYMTLRNAAFRGGETGKEAQGKLDKLLASDSPTGNFAKLIHEYVSESGGFVSFNTMIDNLRDESGGLLDAESKYKSVRGGRALLDTINRFSETGDLLTRIATYDTYKKRGLSKRAAGQKARDLSDFEQRGANEMTDYGRLLYSFFNSSMVGSGVIADLALNSKYNTETMAIGLAMGMSIVPLLASIAGDDEDGNIYLKKGNSISHLMLPIPGTEKLVQLSINYNLGGLMFLVGNQMARLAMGAQDYGDTTQNLISILQENLSPVSNEIPVTADEQFFQKWFALMTPTVLQSPLGLAMNTNNFGGTIYSTGAGFNPIGDYTKAYDSTYSQIGTGIEALTRGAAALGMPLNTRGAQYLAGEWLGGYNTLLNFGMEMGHILTGGAGDNVNIKNAALGVGGFIANPENSIKQRFFDEAADARGLLVDLRKFTDPSPTGDGLSREEGLRKIGATEDDARRAEIIIKADNAVRDLSRKGSVSKSNRTSESPGARRRRALEFDAKADPIRLDALRDLDR